MLNTKNFIKQFIPPIVFHYKKAQFSGNYPSWEDALKHSTGYDALVILDRICSALLKVKNGEAVYERDSVLFDKIQYSWPLLAGLLRTAAMNGNRLHVLDFGGSLGSSYYQNKFFLSSVTDLKWCIVEQANFVERGKKYFEDETLRFYFDVSACLAHEKIDVVILSSVLPYLETPFELLDTILSHNIPHVIIDRTPILLKGDKDQLTVQNASPSIYPASYPAWFFNRSKFLSHVHPKYDIIVEFEALANEMTIKSPFCSAIDKGFILQKKL